MHLQGEDVRALDIRDKAGCGGLGVGEMRQGCKRVRRGGLQAPMVGQASTVRREGARSVQSGSAAGGCPGHVRARNRDRKAADLQVDPVAVLVDAVGADFWSGWIDGGGGIIAVPCACGDPVAVFVRLVLRGVAVVTVGSGNCARRIGVAVAIPVGVGHAQGGVGLALGSAGAGGGMTGSSRTQ